MPRNVTGPGYNETQAILYELGLCTIGQCPLEWAQVKYVPSLGGNAFYLALFALVLAAQLGLGIRYRTWSYMGCMLAGLILEIIGYVSRIQIHNNPFKHDPFLLYIITLTIAPVFFAAAIYFAFGYVHLVYGPQMSRLSSKTYKIIFIGCDIFSLVLQSIGGGIANTASTQSGTQTGINIMVAGLSFQVFSLFIFITLASEFFWTVNKRAAERTAEHSELRDSTKFKLFLAAFVVATFAIFTRSIFRVAELSEGFGGRLANEEVTFMILEGGMVSLAVLLMTFFHPGMCLKSAWNKRATTKA